MPLFEKTRVEVYLPDLPTPPYQRLLGALRAREPRGVEAVMDASVSHR